jgi:hypothetical protein
LLALIALGIVSRFQPAWLGVELKAAAAEQDVRPERLSRLVSRAIALFEPLVARLTRRGRPPRVEPDGLLRSELAVTRALLEVATALLARTRWRGRAVRELVVGAYRRLAAEPGIRQKRFCEALSLPARTLRHWLRHAPRRAAEPAAAPVGEPRRRRRRDRGPRRQRFGFDVLLPGTQVGADTTDLGCLGVPLKLIAAQDIGGRDEALFDAVLVDEHESAELVVQVVTAALRDREGAQAITDQGTPYLAARTRETLDELEADHAPQREADPLGKATVERAFLSVKSIAGPLLALTDRIALALPHLRQPELAKAVTTVLLTALLRAYQHGARAARAAVEARGGIDADELARRAEHSRERARATERSAKLLLEHLHAVYHLAGKAAHFVRTFRTYPLAVLHDAERALRDRLLRHDLEPVRDPWRYFGAIVRRLFEEHRQRVARQRYDREQQRDSDQQHRQQQRRLDAFRDNPLSWLRHGLDLLARQWLPDQGALLFGGNGYALGTLRAALRRLGELHPRIAADLARGALHDFRIAELDRLGQDGVNTIADLLERELAKLSTNHDCAPAAASAILTNTGKTPRPPPSGHLPI